MAKKLNTNSNTYIIVYSTILVVIVAFLLSFVFQALKPMQDENVKLDTKIHKLNALNIRHLKKSAVNTEFSKVYRSYETIDDVSYEIYLVNGQTKYLVPVKGQGLWGPISGYISINDDKNTIFGADFQHEGETAGLGALITEEYFQNRFCGKKITDESSDAILLSIVKAGTAGNSNYNVDGITGATLTSNGVDEMVRSGLKNFKEAVK